MKCRPIPLCALALSLAPAFAESPWPKGLVLEGRVAFTEGPAWHAASESVFFTDIENNRIMRRMKDGTFQVYRHPSGGANGLIFDAGGRLYACEGSAKRVTRTELDGTITVLAKDFGGKAFNGPNDLALAADGSVYFTDPRYGPREGMEIFDAGGRTVEGVYRIAPDGNVTRVTTHEVDRPNGIVISPDGKRLYVADNVNSGPDNGVGGNRKLWRFDLRPDGGIDPASRKLLFDWGTERGPDGMCWGPDDKLYVTAGLLFANPPVETADKYPAAVYVIDPESGGLIRTLPVPEDMITNCTFGGKDGRTLFVTAGHKLWSLRIEGTDR
ncbi:MAG: SMP-30/gluconolactonase/LRE family protein [Verrucomicrobia bacterium]|nr:SMP-30/gluconolactonase/LRE family protein [Verrucomicrobiota bacterium]